MLSNILFEETNRSLQWPGLDLRNNIQERKSTFDQFQKLSDGCFQINYGEPLNKHTSKLKCFPNPLDITKSRNANNFLPHAVCYEKRACQLLNFRSRKVEKGPFAALIIESPQNYFKRISGNQCDSIYFLPKIVNGESLWQKFIPMRPRPLLQRSPFEGALTICHVIMDIR